MSAPDPSVPSQAVPTAIGSASATSSASPSPSPFQSPSQSDASVSTLLLANEMPKSCQYCQCSPNKMQRCSSCQCVYYCDRNCQKDDWKNHKAICAKKSANRIIPTRMDAISIIKAKIDTNCWAHAFSFLSVTQLGRVSCVNHCFRSASLKPAAACQEFVIMANHSAFIGKPKRYHLPINLQYGERVRDRNNDMILPPEVIPVFPKLERMRFDFIFNYSDMNTKFTTDKQFADRLNQWLPQVASTLKYLELPLRLPETSLDAIAPSLSNCLLLETLILTRFTVQSEVLRIVPEFPKLKALSFSTLIVSSDFFTMSNEAGFAEAVAECKAVLPKFIQSISLCNTLRALEVDHSHGYHSMAWQLLFNTAKFPHLEWLSAIIQEFQGANFNKLKTDELVHLKHMGTNFPSLKSLSLTIRMNECTQRPPPRTPARNAEELAYRDALLDNLQEGLKPLSNQLRSFFMVLASEMSDGRSEEQMKLLESMIARREFDTLSFTHRPIECSDLDKLLNVMLELYSFQLQTMRAGRAPSLFTKESIESIAKHCPKLRYLELMYDQDKPDDLLPLTQLKHLKRLLLKPLSDEATTVVPPEPTTYESTPPLTHQIGNDPCVVRLMAHVNQTHMPILRSLPRVKRLESENHELHFEVLFAYAHFTPLAMNLQVIQDFYLKDFKSYRDTMQTHPQYFSRGTSYRFEHEVQSITQEQYELIKQIPNVVEHKLSESPFKHMYEYAMNSIARDRAALKESTASADDGSASSSDNERLWWMPETLHMMNMNIGSNRFGAYDPLPVQKWVAVYDGHFLEYNVPLTSKTHLEKPVLNELFNKKAADIITADHRQLSCSRLVVQPLLYGKNWLNELDLVE